MDLFILLTVLFISNIGILLFFNNVARKQLERIENLEYAFIDIDEDGNKFNKRIQRLKKKVRG